MASWSLFISGLYGLIYLLVARVCQAIEAPKTVRHEHHVGSFTIDWNKPTPPESAGLRG